MKKKYVICYTSPNQRIVSVKKTLSDKNHLYGICNIAATLSAAKNLSDRAFKLFIRLMLHEDTYTFALSPAEINANIGMSDDRYRNAIKELIEKGYLVQNPERKNHYTIYEAPSVDCDIEKSSMQNEVSDDVVTGNSLPQNDGAFPADTGGEIVPDITSQLHNNNTEYSNYQTLIYQRGQARQREQALLEKRALIENAAEDDAAFFDDMGFDDEHAVDNDELPF